ATLIDIATAAQARAKRPKARSAAAAESVPARAPAGTGQAGAAKGGVAEVEALAGAAEARVAASEAVAATAQAARQGPALRAPAAAPTRKSRRDDDDVPKLFVLDTNVLMHDPSSLFRFAEHDVFLPMMTLEELDHHKKGMSEVSRNVRQVSRSLDALIETVNGNIDEGISLSALGNREASGCLFFQTQSVASILPSGLPMGTADNQILGVL